MTLLDQAAVGGPLRAATTHHVRARLVDLELRDPSAQNSGGQWWTITGHAAVYDQPTTLYTSDAWKLTEEVARGAFDDVLARTPDVHLNLNHDMKFAMARTGLGGAGALDLSSDAIGLRIHARVPTTLAFAADVVEQMRVGIIDQMSFAFTIADEEHSSGVDANGVEYDHFRITRVGELFDVCVCAQGAYPQTDSAVLHSRIAGLGRAVEPAGRERSDRAVEPAGRDGTDRAVDSAGRDAAHAADPALRAALRAAVTRAKFQRAQEGTTR